MTPRKGGVDAWTDNSAKHNLAREREMARAKVALRFRWGCAVLCEKHAREETEP